MTTEVNVTYNEDIPEKKSYRIGNYFKDVNKSLCVLSAVADRAVALIYIESGTRFEDGVKVQNLYNITDEEFSEITGGYPQEFTQVKQIDIVAKI